MDGHDPASQMQVICAVFPYAYILRTVRPDVCSKAHVGYYGDRQTVRHLCLDYLEVNNQVKKKRQTNMCMMHS